eukprot:991623-Pleurochrysis_carterae.AAC.3
MFQVVIDCGRVARVPGPLCPEKHSKMTRAAVGPSACGHGDHGKRGRTSAPRVSPSRATVCPSRCPIPRPPRRGRCRRSPTEPPYGGQCDAPVHAFKWQWLHTSCTGRARRRRSSGRRLKARLRADAIAAWRLGLLNNFNSRPSLLKREPDGDNSQSLAATQCEHTAELAGNVVCWQLRVYCKWQDFIQCARKLTTTTADGKKGMGRQECIFGKIDENTEHAARRPGRA